MRKFGETFQAVKGGIVERYHSDKEYVYQEYPKAVYLADGSYVIVDNAEEESILTAPKDEPKRRGRPPKHA